MTPRSILEILDDTPFYSRNPRWQPVQYIIIGNMRTLFFGYPEIVPATVDEIKSKYTMKIVQAFLDMQYL